jgi:hypothetical protein
VRAMRREIGFKKDYVDFKEDIVHYHSCLEEG